MNKCNNFVNFQAAILSYILYKIKEVLRYLEAEISTKFEAR